MTYPWDQIATINSDREPFLILIDATVYEVDIENPVDGIVRTTKKKYLLTKKMRERSTPNIL